MKKTCPNGHVYDQNIYGDTCPLCPPATATSAGNNGADFTKPAPAEASPSTRVAQPAQNAGSPIGGMAGLRQDPIGNTQVSPALRQQQQKPQTPKTTIRRPGGQNFPGSGKPGEADRKLVGFLVTYNHTPMGKAFNIYEGRNFIGRDADCDISVPDDNQMSGKHMLIRYLTGDGKFRFRDEMSSNGTYVNKQLVDEGELQNYDIIRVGSTLFIFIAIPQ